MSSPRTARTVGWSCLLGLLLPPAVSWSDSGVGVDTWRADKLDPTGGDALAILDPNGTSWLESG